MRSEPRLYHYIRKYKDAGHPEKKINQLLQEHGYTERDITTAQKEFATSPDHAAEDKMVAYLEKHMKTGHRLTDLVEHAMKNNIDKHLLQRAVLRVNTQHQPKQEVVHYTPSIMTWKDIFLLFFIFCALVVSFANIIMPYATVALLAAYIVRWTGATQWLLGVAIFALAAGFGIISEYLGQHTEAGVAILVATALIYILPTFVRAQAKPSGTS